MIASCIYWFTTSRIPYRWRGVAAALNQSRSWGFTHGACRPPGDAASGTASLCTSYIAQSTGDLSCPRQDAPSARISSQHVRELLAVRSQAAVTALLKECPQIAELEPSCILSRLVRLKGHCSGCMNPTDLVFLEPRILLWDGPFVTCPYTMEVLSKIAKNIGEMIIMMTKETNSGDGDTIRWKDHIEFGDAVPFVDNFYARIKDLKRDVIGCGARVPPSWDDWVSGDAMFQIELGLQRRLTAIRVNRSLQEALSKAET